MISREAWPRTQRNPWLSGLSGSPRTPTSRPSSTSTSIPQRVGWQFIGHIVRTVRPTGVTLPFYPLCARPSVVQDLGEEQLGPLGAGRPEELLLRLVLDDLSLVHEDHPVGDTAGEAHLVGDHHHRHPLA